MCIIEISKRTRLDFDVLRLINILFITVPVYHVHIIYVCTSNSANMVVNGHQCRSDNTSTYYVRHKFRSDLSYQECIYSVLHTNVVFGLFEIFLYLLSMSSECISFLRYLLWMFLDAKDLLIYHNVSPFKYKSIPLRPLRQYACTPTGHCLMKT